MTSLPSLPLEVTELIVQRLHKGAVCACVRVSKTCYASFLPFLWEHLRIHANAFNRRPSATALAQRASLVTDLELVEYMPEQYYAICFPHLNTLKIVANRYIFGRDVCHVAFIKANPTVQDLTLNIPPVGPTDEFWEAN